MILCYVTTLPSWVHKSGAVIPNNRCKGILFFLFHQKLLLFFLMFNNIKLVKLPETIGLAALWWCKKLAMLCPPRLLVLRWLSLASLPRSTPDCAPVEVTHARKNQINLAFRSLNRNVDLRSKLLTLGKTKWICFFARLIVTLTFGRSYSRSEKPNEFVFSLA